MFKKLTSSLTHRKRPPGEICLAKAKITLHNSINENYVFQFSWLGFTHWRIMDREHCLVFLPVSPRVNYRIALLLQLKLS